MTVPTSKIIYLTAGAGGMFCGSCMHDNALTHALRDAGWDIQLFPTYTPIRTDEQDVSVDHVLFGGVNVYLQQKVPLLRHVPAFLDRFLDSPWLIRKVTARAMETDPKMLGQLTLSMLKGKHGNQRKEVKQMCKWLNSVNPGLVLFSNILIGGCIESIKEEHDLPILVTLQGDDVFLDSLQEPFRAKCIDRIKEIANHVDGFIVQSEFFKEYMGDYFSIPADKFHVTPLGIELHDFDSFADRQHVAVANGQRQVIGYLARLAPEKGLHRLVDAFLHLKQQPGTDHIQLRIAGWLGPGNQGYADEQFQRLVDAGWESDFEYLGSIERTEKLDFLRSVDVLSVPTEFQEPKGLYVLESLAAGVPVVQPDHGAFRDLIESTGGGLLVRPGDAEQLAMSLLQVLNDHQLRGSLARQGRDAVYATRDASAMAKSTSAVLQQHLGGQA